MHRKIVKMLTPKNHLFGMFPKMSNAELSHDPGEDSRSETGEQINLEMKQTNK